MLQRLTTPPRRCAVWLLHSAGLDALVLQKSIALCIQLFLPIAFVGCCLRERRAAHCCCTPRLERLRLECLRAMVAGMRRDTACPHSCCTPRRPRPLPQ